MMICSATSETCHRCSTATKSLQSVGVSDRPTSIITNGGSFSSHSRCLAHILERGTGGFKFLRFAVIENVSATIACGLGLSNFLRCALFWIVRQTDHLGTA